jgi:hypothetical protein
LNLKFLNELAASNDRNFKFTTLVAEGLRAIKKRDGAADARALLPGRRG